MTDYTELDRIKAVQDKSQTIGEFLEWLQHEKHYELAKWDEKNGDRLKLVNFQIEKLIAEYFGIDLEKAEQERMKMLEEFRKRNEEKK